MTALRAFLAQRRPDLPLLQGTDGQLRPGEILPFRPAHDDDRCIALSVRDHAGLLKLLGAHDGRCRALLLLSASMAADDVRALMDEAGASLLISDRDDLDGSIRPEDAIRAGAPDDQADTLDTAWMLTTSGTTGRPKIVSHSFASLTRTVRGLREGAAPAIWGLSYDPYRFAGLQVVLQAICGGGTLAAFPAHASIKAQLQLFGEAGVTHLSATPTRWRQYLMHPESAALAVGQITLGGEIADQAVLDMLRARFPSAKITHIYASTETGVGFSVQDGREGFPADWLSNSPGAFSLKLADDMLWIKAPSSPKGYLDRGFDEDADGFVNTQDRVAVQGDRVVFLGRATGAVNIGGAKVHPETVEQHLNAHPGVALSRVVGRKNPFSGSILVAEVVPTEWPADEPVYKAALLQHCRSRLPTEAVPATVKLVRDLNVSAAGKLERMER